MSAVLRNFLAASAVAVLAGCTTMGGHGGAQSPTQAQADLASNSASLLQQQMSRPPQKRIPRELIASAKCIGVFPSIIQAGFIVGGHHGTGLISCRQSSSGWSQAAPAVYTISGGSIGLQAGAQKSSVILLFQTESAVNSLLSNKIKLGTQIGVTAGPLGFNANVATKPSPIVAYITSKKGLFAGVNLNGNRLSYNQDSNAEVYGPSTDQSSLLLSSHPIPPVMEPFSQALQNFTPASSQ
ncbi:lipid-binding SYLF domain-containing protein [Salinisphaera sp.]|uniref:lipid-binding SYLF domain-containing protein n=1 Tax=Salinisphaera sp. TaxID=1914330 RepID=UPI002D7837DD|nr:lipid-binding SYLF domain-containing protein [Salinisphaera sp.]HET7315563.1 lipid-binding SYLF domain-containing protein [Salinisphaera sp.]